VSPDPQRPPKQQFCRSLKLDFVAGRTPSYCLFNSVKMIWPYVQNTEGVNKSEMKKCPERRKHCARDGCSKVWTPPARQPVRPLQTGLITIHCTAKLSMQCNNNKLEKNVPINFDGWHPTRPSLTPITLMQDESYAMMVSGSMTGQWPP